MPASRWIMLSLAGAMSLSPCGAWADPNLARLACVNVQAAVLEAGGSLGVTTEVVRDTLLTGLKAQMPTLKVDPQCPNRLFVKIFVQNLFEGFYGHVAFDVRRKAAFADTALPVEARAWTLESYVHGTKDQARTSILEQLHSHLVQFAADYKAVNP
jgi:hypothetical protein